MFRTPSNVLVLCTGLAEVARTLFAVAGRFPGKGFEDVRLNRDQFAAKKKAGELGQNLNRMPILNHNGAVIGQSSAINNHLAQQFGLLGTNSVEAAQIEAMVGHIKDVFAALVVCLDILDGLTHKPRGCDLPFEGGYGEKEPTPPRKMTRPEEREIIMTAFPARVSTLPSITPPRSFGLANVYLPL